MTSQAESRSPEKHAGQVKLSIELPADAPIYENKADIPQEPLRYLFNSGHVRNQLNPFLPELVEKYGAVVYKVKNEFSSGSQVYVGIEPSKLFEWYLTQISDQERQTSWVHLRLALMESFAKGWTARTRKKLATETIQPVAAYNILFGMRQQLGQYFNLVTHLDVIEEQMSRELWEFALKRIDQSMKTLDFMLRQLQAAEVFFEGLSRHLKKPDTQRIIMAIPELVFEVNTAFEMLDSARSNMAGEAEVREKMLHYRADIQQKLGESVATPPQTE